MFDLSHYVYDSTNGISQDAHIKKGAILYKATSSAHCHKNAILTGRGPEQSRQKGRFNVAQQRTTYCSNNVIACFAEILFHMWHKAIEGIQNNLPASDINRNLVQDRILVIFSVDEIPELVYFDADEVRNDYGQRLGGTMAVCPDIIYTGHTEFANQIRAKFKRGIIYPSARHSRDICIALFEDESPKLNNDVYEIVDIKLRLIREEQIPGDTILPLSIFSDKIHPTLGYYKFADKLHLESLNSRGVINPANIPPEGLIDFVRRRYVKYPNDAVLFK